MPLYLWRVSKSGTLYLIPTPIVPGAVEQLPQHTIGIIHGLRHFIVENARTARRFISATKPPFRIEELSIEEIPKHADTIPLELLQPLVDGKDVGMMSEAGLPAVADPGAAIVLAAHTKGYRVSACLGPSSVMLALMASGLNGQQFQFHGYLSVKKEIVRRELQKLQDIARKTKATQLFIEAPHRNRQIIAVALSALDAHTLFCIACDIGAPDSFIRTGTIMFWRKFSIPDLHKRPAVFAIGV